MASSVLRFRVSRWRMVAARLFVRAVIVLVWVARPVPPEAARIERWVRRVLAPFVSRGVYQVRS